MAAAYADEAESVGCPDAHAVSQQIQVIKPAERNALLLFMDGTLYSRATTYLDDSKYVGGPSGQSRSGRLPRLTYWDGSDFPSIQVSSA